MEYVIVSTICVFIYLMPTFIATKNNHRNKNPITIINIFLGWTGLFWVICLAWAYMEDRDGVRRNA